LNYLSRRDIDYARNRATQQKEYTMGNTYKKIELTGTSDENVEDAVNTALEKASESVRNMRWFEITEIRGAVDGQKVSQWQVTLKVGFTVE
jgi:flavin-binding protein dodecin